MSRQKKQKAFNDQQITASDSYRNLAANLGTKRDKASYGEFVDNELSNHQLYTMYSNSWLAAAIIDYPAEDATRNWRNWKADTEQINKIEAIEKRLSLKEKVQEAQKAADLFGWSVIYINTRQDKQEQPLQINEEIRSLVVLSGDTVTYKEIVTDIDSDWFGQPEYFEFRSKDKQVTVHASRFALFYGAKAPAGFGGYAGARLGISRIKSTMESINQVSSALANTASLIFEAKVDVFKIKDLARILADKSCDGAGMVTNRMTLQALIKGINGALVLDAEDEYDQKSANLSGLAEICNLFLKAFAGAARIPVTRLFGRESAGLSGSGDGDERTYNDRIKDLQSTGFSPALRRIDDCILYQALGSRPLDIYYEWAPLRNKTEVENADILGKIATAARTLLGQSGGEVIPADVISEAVSNTLIESGSLPGLEQAIKKYGNIAEQNNLVGGEDDEI